MKALAITGQEGKEKVQYMDVERPTLGPREVLVKTRAAALNRLDIFVRNNLDSLKLAPPHIAGADGAGVVAELGAEVRTIKAGDRVLINPGLSCGVSTAALQIAKAVGLRAFVTSSRDEKLQRAKNLGADVVINYKTQDFAREVREITKRRGVDVVVDSVGGDTYAKSLASLVKV